MFARTPWFVLLPIVCLATILLHGRPVGATEPTLRVLATTFPVYQIIRNLVQGVDGLSVDLMIPAEMGCPHDYALTPQDMRKLAQADILVINGLGLEEFMGAPVKKANPKLTIVDSSEGVGPILRYSGQTVPNKGGKTGTERRSGNDRHGHDKDHGHHHDHDDGPNPHLFASPRMAALMTGTIGRALAKRHPAGAARIGANAEAYAGRLNQLADDMADLGKRLANTRIVTQHGVFDYLARDMGLEVVAVVQAHGGQNPSAAEMRAIVATIGAKKAGGLFTEPQYPAAVGATIARESGIPTARLDPAANGFDQAPLDYYEQVMRTNMATLEQTLGSR